MSNLKHERKALKRAGMDTTAVDLLASQIFECQDVETAERLLDKLDVIANELGWPTDKDYAAVSLQHYSKFASNQQVRMAMLNAAERRARWCTCCASSGGEGLARAQHLEEIESMLRDERAKHPVQSEYN